MYDPCSQGIQAVDILREKILQGGMSDGLVQSKKNEWYAIQRLLLWEESQKQAIKQEVEDKKKREALEERRSFYKMMEEKKQV